MLTDQSTISDLANMLNELGATIRIRTQWTRQGTRFITSRRVPRRHSHVREHVTRTRAQRLHRVLGPCTSRTGGGRRDRRRPIRTAPTSARPPTLTPPARTVGHVLTPLHCAVCGFGEEEGDTYRPDGACMNCGTVGQPCPMEPGHEGNHALREDSGEPRWRADGRAIVSGLRPRRKQKDVRHAKHRTLRGLRTRLLSAAP